MGSPFPARFGAKRGNLGMELTGKVWCVNPRSRSRAALCHVLSAAVGWLARLGKGKVKGNSAPRGRGEREEEINPHPLAQPLVPCLLFGGGGSAHLGAAALDFGVSLTKISPGFLVPIPVSEPKRLFL